MQVQDEWSKGARDEGNKGGIENRSSRRGRKGGWGKGEGGKGWMEQGWWEEGMKGGGVIIRRRGAVSSRLRVRIGMLIILCSGFVAI
jgi:hypothetical protein